MSVFLLVGFITGLFMVAVVGFLYAIYDELHSIHTLLQERGRADKQAVQA